MPKCLICEQNFEPFISFGKMPIANGFLHSEQFNEEYFFELKVGHCSKCHMVQLTEFVDREKMFHENYAFFSSTSIRMDKHFKEFAEWTMKNYLKSEDSFVVEIGSNDGIMLKNFKEKGIKHLGVEPSSNVAEVAKQSGINTISCFFDGDTAQNIEKDYSKADVIQGANVMCHIPYIHSVMTGVKKLLKPKGVLIFEDPYMGDIFEKTSYDQIYDEHAFYFSAHSVSYLVGIHDLELIDVLPQNVHGGSMRYVIAHKGEHITSIRVTEILQKEEKLGLLKDESYNLLSKNIEKSKDVLVDLLEKLKEEGKRVVGYGATSKSTTVTNYCGITPDLVEFVSDTTPIKQGKLTPGAHIPVRNYDEFSKNYPEYALLFAWNHAQEIFEKESKFRQAGGKFIVYVPEVKIV